MLLLAGFLGFYLVEMKQLKLENEMFCGSVIFQVRTLWINDSNNWGMDPDNERILTPKNSENPDY